MKSLSLLLLLIITACAFSAPPERTRYALSPEAVLPLGSEHARHTGIIRVAATTAPYDLDSASIQVQTGEHISSIENVAWVRRLPAMLQPLIMSTLERSGKYGSVVDDASSVVATRQLHVSIERFTLVTPPAESAYVEIDLRAELINPESGNLITVRSIHTTEPVSMVRMHVIIPAFERALARALSEMTEMLR